MLHKRQAPGRDIHKHFSLAPARSHTMTASNRASASRQTQEQQTAKQALQSKQHSNRNPLPLPHPPNASNRERAQTVKGEKNRRAAVWYKRWRIRDVSKFLRRC